MSKLGENSEPEAKTVASFTDAIKRNDGLNAADILQEVGTCAWPGLIKNASEQLKREYVIGFELSREMSMKGEEPYSQRLRITKGGGYTALPLVELTGPLCKKK